MNVLRSDNPCNTRIADHPFANRTRGTFSHFNEAFAFYIFLPCKVKRCTEHTISRGRQHGVLLCVNRSAIPIISGVMFNIEPGAFFIYITAVRLTPGRTVISGCDDFIIFYNNTAILPFETCAAGRNTKCDIDIILVFRISFHFFYSAFGLFTVIVPLHGDVNENRHTFVGFAA